ncbi:hypothetical protein ACFPRL_26975 [Pseudoclavibacter helvolus]
MVPEGPRGPRRDAVGGRSGYVPPRRRTGCRLVHRAHGVSRVLHGPGGPRPQHPYRIVARRATQHTNGRPRPEGRIPHGSFRSSAEGDVRRAPRGRRRVGVARGHRRRHPQGSHSAHQRRPRWPHPLPGGAVLHGSRDCEHGARRGREGTHA